MRCAVCEEPAWYRCGRTAKLVCARHARLEVVAREGDREAGPVEVRKATERDCERLKEIALEMGDATNEETFWQNLIDFQLLMDRGAGREEGVREASELVDWIVTFQSGSADDLAHAIEQWRTAINRGNVVSSHHRLLP